MFVDNLAYLLFALGFVGVLTLYMTIGVFMSYKKTKKLNIYDMVSGGILPLGLLGAYLFIMAVVGQLEWQLPGPYNMVFFDPLAALSIVLIGFAWSIRSKLKMHYVGLLSLMAGLMVIFYGLNGYAIGLTQSPTAFLVLYVAFGFVGILSFPVSLIMDLKPGITSNYPQIWTAFLVLFWIALIIATVMSFLIGGAAIAPHFASPP